MKNLAMRVTWKEVIHYRIWPVTVIYVASSVETRHLPQRSRRANVSYTMISSSELEESDSDVSEDSSEEPSRGKAVISRRRTKTNSDTHMSLSQASDGVIDLTDGMSQPSPKAKTPKKTSAKPSLITPKNTPKKPAAAPTRKRTTPSTKASDKKATPGKKKTKKQSSSSEDNFSDADVQILSQSSVSRRSSRGKVISYAESSSEGWNDSD